jgi:hypothetical protein
MNNKQEVGAYLYANLKKVIKYVLIGLQQTNFPIPLSEQKDVVTNYLKLVKGRDYDESRKVIVKDFIGPSSSTLQMINLLQPYDINDTNKTIPNIRTNYTVTDKADGMRKLLYINNDGKIYLIPMSMNIEFTGCKTENKEIFNTIIDGEHILHDKNGEFINLYAAFDVYFINMKNVTGSPFINVEKLQPIQKQKKPKLDEKKEDDDEDEDENEKEQEEQKAKMEASKAEYRLNLLKSVIKNIKLLSSVSKNKPPLNVNIKKFYGINIFQGCSRILTGVENGLYPYNTDGLIFTPANTGVASNKIGIAAPNYKTTWNESFKWKPAEFNTVDFLIKFQKDDFGVNKVGSIYNNGTNMTSNSQLQNYFTLILNVGFDEKKHGYINPCNDIINDYIKTKSDSRESYKNEYKPARFYPTNPSDENAGICNVLGKFDESNNIKIYTEEGEEIEDNTIVEFRYDTEKPNLWKWIPLRVRYDKTSELRSGVKNFGNAYHVANSNWQSIHNPITNKIISSGEYVKVDNSDDDVYYNKVSNHSETRSLRDFHNLYVKNLLLSKVTNTGYTLIDYACGKGGDLPKWINASLEFVLGVDLNRDNIENRIDGACARYLNYAKKFTTVPKALFVNGNSAFNIKNGDAFATDKNKQIIKAIFGEGTKNEITLGKGVYNNYGISKNGFNISSIQFAIHYMFENELLLNEFLKNVAQCTALEGYLIGTCFDGNKVFNMLNTKDINQSISLFKNDKKIFEITKKYSNELYLEDETCIGYGIDVYQETINKTFREYLVNFKYLIRIMENYGFVLLNDDEVKSLDLPGSIGGFEELYNRMNYDIKRDKRVTNKIGSSLNMSKEEKTISFLNKYFVFKKVRNIQLVTSDNLKTTDEDEDKEIYNKMENISEDIETIEKTNIEKKSKKMAEKYLENLDKDETLQDIKSKEEDKEAKSAKIKLDIEEKIKKYELKKKLKEEKKK